MLSSFRTIRSPHRRRSDFTRGVVSMAPISSGRCAKLELCHALVCAKAPGGSHSRKINLEISDALILVQYACPAQTILGQRFEKVMLLALLAVHNGIGGIWQTIFVSSLRYGKVADCWHKNQEKGTIQEQEKQSAKQLSVFSRIDSSAFSLYLAKQALRQVGLESQVYCSLAMRPFSKKTEALGPKFYRRILSV